jgi:hypothetical protein
MKTGYTNCANETDDRTRIPMLAEQVRPLADVVTTPRTGANVLQAAVQTQFDEIQDVFLSPRREPNGRMTRFNAYRAGRSFTEDYRFCASANGPAPEAKHHLQRGLERNSSGLFLL